MIALSLRPGTPADHALVFATWLRSFRKSDATRHIPSDVYYARQHDRIEQLLRTGQLEVATPEGDPLTALGYAVMDGPTLHWLYVKGSFRHLGIAHRLIDGRGLLAYSHETSDGQRLAQKLGLRYNPYAAER